MKWRSELLGALEGSGPGARLALLSLGLLVFPMAPRRLDAEGSKEEAPAKAAVKVEEVTFPENLGRSLPERGGWLPIYVELQTTSRQAETVLLEGRVGTNEKEKFMTRARIEVAPGAPRRAWIYLRMAPGDSVQETVSLDVRLASGLVIQKKRWIVSSPGLHRLRLSMLVVGESLGDITPWPGDLSSAGNYNTLGDFEHTADFCPAKALPDRVTGYHGMDIVLLRDLGEGRLEPAQIEALRSWVHLGGLLVLVPSSHSSEIFRTEIAHELCGDALREPQPEDGFVPRNLFYVDRERRNRERPALFAKSDKISLGSGRSFTLMDPIRGEMKPLKEILSSDGDDAQDPSVARLYCELGYGQGRVGILTINDQTHREAGANFLRELWSKIVECRLGSPKGSFAEHGARLLAPELESLLNDESRDVGLAFITAIIAVYLLLVGPGLYLVLKRWNRLPAVIWAEPLLVVVYLGIIFGTAYITKGVLTKTRILTFFTQREGEDLALRESYFSIFSADDALYRIDCPRGEWLQPIFKNEREAQPIMLSQGPKGELSLEDFKLAHWQQGHVSNIEVMEWKDMGVTLESLAPSGDQGDLPVVAITNHLPYPIVEGIFFGATSRATVPRIEAGQTVKVRPEKGAEETKERKKEVSWKRFFSLESALPFQKQGFTPPGQLVFAGLLARGDQDFRLGQRSSLKERIDLYLLYRR